jgi:hypothetical protein
MEEQKDPQQQTAPNQPMPGQIVQPGQQSPAVQQQQTEVQAPVAPQPQYAAQPQTQPTPTQFQTPITPVSPMPVQPNTPTVNNNNDGTISWQASEHINYDNGLGWTFAMLGGGLVLVVAMFLLVDLMSAIVVALLLAGLIVYGKLKPKTVAYAISEDGFSVGDRAYDYSQFRSFSLNINGDIASIFMVPMQRFMIPITVYVAPDNLEAVTNILANHLPQKQRQPDFMDRLSARLRL